MDIKGKKLLVLGGIALAKEIVKAAQRLGVHVSVTDYLSNSPAKQIADESYMVSTLDVDGIVDLIKTQNIDGVFTGFIDSLLPAYAEVCKKADRYCYGTYEQFILATDKEKFKQLCSKHDVPTVLDYQIKYPFSKEDLAKIQYPILIKPIDNSGARGIFICHDQEELLQNYPLSLTFSKAKRILIEKYMQAKEATISYVIQDGKITLSSMADRHVKNRQKSIVPLPVAYTYPSIHQKRYQEHLDEKVKKMFEAAGIKNGTLHIQTFIEDGECVFYEIGYRLTGSLEYKIINQMNAFNSLEAMINFALTGKMSDIDISDVIDPNYQDYGFNLTFLIKPGKIKKILGVEETKKLANVLDVVTSYQVNDEIPASAVGTLKQVIIRVFGYAKTKQEMISLIKDIQSLIKVYDDNDEDMLLPVFDTNDLEDDHYE